MLGSASQFQVQFVLVSAGQHQSARWPASAGASKKQPAAVCGSYRRPVPASASELASQPGEPDRKTDRDRATSEPGRQLGRQTAANRISHPADQASRQPGCSSGQFAAGTVLRSVALLYESPGGNQVDGLPPVPTYQSACQSDREETHQTEFDI